MTTATPNPRRIRQWPYVLLIVFGAFVLMFLLFAARQAPKKAEETKPATLVQLQAVVPQDLRYTVRSQATVQAKTETSLVSEVNGKIIDIADSFVAGGFFKKGELLVRVEPADYQTSVKSAEAALANATATLEEERARAKVAETEWQSFTAGRAPALGLRKPQLASALAKVRSAEADLERARRDLSRTEIRAPYDGIVKTRQANLGQFVSRGSQLGVVLDTAVAEIRFPLSQQDMQDLGPYQAQLALPTSLFAQVGDKQLQWQATVVRTEGVLDEKSRVIYAVAEFMDPYQRQGHAEPLRFGQFVRAEIQGRMAGQVTELPRHLLKPGQQVLVADKDLQLQFRTVEVDRTDDKHAYIRQGLLAGDQLVVSPLANPLPGLKVRTEASSPVAEKQP